MNSLLLQAGITLLLNLQLKISDKEINFLDTTVNLIQDKPLLREIYEPPIISFKRRKSLGDILIRAKL